MSFSVLKLPSVARGELLKLLTPIELYLFGNTSKRAARIVPESNSRKFSITVNSRSEVTVNQRFTFQILGSHSINYFNRQNTFVIDQGMHAFYKDDGGLEVCLEGRRSLTDFIIDVFMMFRCTVKSVQYQMDALRLPYLLKYIQDNQSVAIENLEIIGRFESRELKWILENIKVTKRLEVWTMVEPGFEVNFSSDCDILILRGFWITDTMLQSFDSSAVIVVDYDHRQLSATNLNDIINGWQAGSYPKLEYLGIDSIYIEKNVEVNGITTNAMLEKNFKSKKKLFDGEYIGYFRNGVQINAVDGKVGFLQWTSKERLFPLINVESDYGKFEFFCFDIDDIPQKLEN
ncbi:hypothetical protein CAEBREN_21962 [Caenorhabditis brenneri]|uniref:F-box domain-containing protein n=1 Tax=Caenorhabditis brenneri TaxID=135651 RepID=G0P786_CAEBE|nr:hypothetical protein CAEBREN_21962 [Caenorhabditis brenneri]